MTSEDPKRNFPSSEEQSHYETSKLHSDFPETAGGDPLIVENDIRMPIDLRSLITCAARQPWRKRILRNQTENADVLSSQVAYRLQHASSLLVDRLFEYLSNCPAPLSEQARAAESSTQTKHIRGLNLPASAIGWLASQLFPTNENPGHRLEETAQQCMSVSMRDRLSLLKFLFPRVTHLRITNKEWPPSGRRNRQNMISIDQGVPVQSVLTGGSTTVNESQCFLHYFHALQHRPNIDLKLFPSLSVLLLDGVPPERIKGMRTVHDKLELFRMEHGCMYNVSSFLFPIESNEMDTETNESNNNDGLVFANLTHLRLCHCCIGEGSGLISKGEELEVGGNENISNLDQSLGRLTRENRYPPLSRMPNLKSLSLAHNELVHMSSALAGLASLPFLMKLDLSFNKIHSMENAFAMLGNIKTLVLTGNCLESTRGLDRLYSLEHLSLDHNNIKDLAEVSGLGRLPELSQIDLCGNPLEKKNSKKYRVDILNLFRENRFSSLPPNATFRQLLQILPALDGKIATNKELLGLRWLTFSHSLTLEHNDGFVISPREDHSYLPLPLPISVNEVNPQYPASESPPAEIEVPSAENMAQAQVIKAPAPSRPRRVQRRSKKRSVLIDNDSGQHTPSTMNLRHGTNEIEGNTRRAVKFSVKDVICSLSPEPIVQPDCEMGGQLHSTVAGSTESTADPFTCAETVIKNVGICFNDLEITQEANLSLLSLSMVEQDEEDHHVTERETNSDRKIDSIKVDEEAIKSEYSTTEPKGLVFSLATEGNDAVDSQGNGHGTSTNSRRTNVTPELRDASTATGTPVVDAVGQLREASFPANIWDDNVSVPSSLGTAQKEHQVPAGRKFVTTERNSIYDGPETYKQLNILVNLDLYFRSFVFPAHETQLMYDQSVGEEQKSALALKVMPRIQLHKDDHAVRDLCPSTIRENFKHYSTEEVVPCGKASRSRLVPNRTPRRGFHGDIVFSRGLLELVSECRKVILCASEDALYFISDYDAVTIHASKKMPNRRFPFPIPENASFDDAMWPHAVSRHLITSLHRITIGFGFQRLTLNFCSGASSGSESMGGASEFTYVLLMSNKMRTISFLQQLQDHFKEAKSSGNAAQLIEDSITIDNDDKQVLDALAEAVAPNVLGVILHYSIVQQRWKHGDRGAVRRICVVTDAKVYLFDEDYAGDGASHNGMDDEKRENGSVSYMVVDSADLDQILEVRGADADPKATTIIVQTLGKLQRPHRWRLLCRDADGVEKLVEDVRKAISLM